MSARQGPGDASYKGLIGGLAVYNRTLTDDELRLLASFTS